MCIRDSTNQSQDVDLILTSANNLYEGVTQVEVENFYGKMKNPADDKPISYGLNSKLVKENGVITEKVYKIVGMYDAAIQRIVFWLEEAAQVAENTKQQKTILTLIDFYRTGNLRTYDDYSVLWVEDLLSQVDLSLIHI